MCEHTTPASPSGGGGTPACCFACSRSLLQACGGVKGSKVLYLTPYLPRIRVFYASILPLSHLLLCFLQKSLPSGVLLQGNEVTMY